MKWRMYLGAAALSAVSFLLGVGAVLSDQSSVNDQQAIPKQSYRVEETLLGKHISFPSERGFEPSTFTLTCNEKGKIDGFMITLDVEPASPPPLRGVFGSFSFPQEARTKVELAYTSNGIWFPREGQSGNVQEIIQRLTEGERLQFLLEKPNGSGKAIAWSGPSKFTVPGCRP